MTDESSPDTKKAAKKDGKRDSIAISRNDEGKGEATKNAGRGPAQNQQSRLSVSRGFANWLGSVRASLAFTSYQTGQLYLVGLRKDKKISFHSQNLVRAMGVHVQGNRLLVGGLAQIWRLENILRRNETANENFDRVYVPRAAMTIGDLDIHELALDRNGRVIFVNTKYSCLATPSLVDSFKPVWKPKFISKLAAEDRCHLNGLCMADGVPKYVTAVSHSDVLNGWRERRHEGGTLIEIETDRVVTDQLSMPHSPRFHGGKIWLLDSGRGYLINVDPETGKSEDVTFCPGFLRGLSIHRGFAIVTASLPRDGTFKGLQLDDNIKERDGEAWCGIYVINMRTGDIVEWIQIDGFIKELFDVAVIPGARCPMSIAIGSPEVQSMITIENGFAPITIDSPAKAAVTPASSAKAIAQAPSGE
jgi:uncharacterized protein (TIGR03032 family)